MPYHIVWITKYGYKVLEGALWEWIQTIIRQVCKELGVQIVSGVMSREHVHMFVEIPPHIAVSDFVRRVKGRSSHRVQMEFPDLRKRYWGRHFWARGYFSTTSDELWPYQREIADCLGDPAIERVTLVKGARVGFTSLLTAAIGYWCARDPAPKSRRHRTRHFNLLNCRIPQGALNLCVGE
jgi:putative transposase